MANLEDVIYSQHRADYFKGLSANIKQDSLASPLAAFFSGKAASQAASKEGAYLAEKDARDMAIQTRKNQLEALQSAAKVLTATGVDGATRAATAAVLLRQAGLTVESVDAQNNTVYIKNKNGSTTTIPVSDDKFNKALEKEDANINLLKTKDRVLREKPTGKEPTSLSEKDILNGVYKTDGDLIAKLGNARIRKNLSESAINGFIDKINGAKGLSEDTKKMLTKNAYLALEEKGAKSSTAPTSGGKSFLSLFR